MIDEPLDEGIPATATGTALRAAAEANLARVQDILYDDDYNETEAVHDLRAALKRWRAFARLLEPLLGEGIHQSRTQARDLARLLSGPRDAQAALDALNDLGDAEGRLSPRSIATITARLEKLRDTAEHPDLLRGARLELGRWLDQTTLFMAGWEFEEITFKQVATRLASIYERARGMVPDVWAEADPEHIHDLRKKVIEHRFQMELVEPLWPRLTKVWVAEAQRLRERLGCFNDLRVLESLTAPHQPLAPWRSRLTPLIAERQARHLESANRLCRRLFADRPKAFRQRLIALADEG